MTKTSTLRILGLLLLIFAASPLGIDWLPPVSVEVALQKISVPDRMVSVSIDELNHIPIPYPSYRNTTFRNTHNVLSPTDELPVLTPYTASLLWDNRISPVSPAERNPFQPGETRWQLTVSLDNDIFANRDFYYTNGLHIALVIPSLNRSPVNRVLAGIKNAGIEMSGLTICQNLYTPTNPDTTVVLYGDRPFAAYLSMGQFRETVDTERKLLMRSEINIGVLGPHSLGQQVQSAIHEINPAGWVNQVSDDIVLNYQFSVEKGLVSNSAMEFNAVGNVMAGTLYDKIGGGFYFRAGNFMPVYRGPFSYFENKNPGGRLQFWIFARGNADYVFYDATLQGGMFSGENIYSIPASQLERIVFRASAGIALYYNYIGIEYEHFYLSPEFKGAQHFSYGRLKGVLAF